MDEPPSNSSSLERDLVNTASLGRCPFATRREDSIRCHWESLCRAFVMPSDTRGLLPHECDPF